MAPYTVRFLSCLGYRRCTRPHLSPPLPSSLRNGKKDNRKLLYDTTDDDDVALL